MTDAEKILLVQAMTEETDASVVSAFLSMAGETIYHYVDPFQTSEKAAVLEEYGVVQAKAAAYFLNKRGADGQVTHSENGISRSYESGDLPASLLREITPKAGAVR